MFVLHVWFIYFFLLNVHFKYAFLLKGFCELRKCVLNATRALPGDDRTKKSGNKRCEGHLVQLAGKASAQGRTGWRDEEGEEQRKNTLAASSALLAHSKTSYQFQTVGESYCEKRHITSRPKSYLLGEERELLY